MGALTDLAAAANRDYITPEDVSDLLATGLSADAVRLQVLEVLGQQTDFGAEDAGLCAFIAWRGTPDA